MNQILTDVLNYVVVPAGGLLVGGLVTHKITWTVVLKKVEVAFVKLAEDIKAGALAPVHAIVNAPGAIEAHKTDAENAALEITKYALLGLTAMKKSYGSMNDAEKFALAQFVNNSVNSALPTTLHVHVTAGGIAKGIESAQGLLDGTSKNPLLATALNLTELAAAITAGPAPVEPQPTTQA